MRLISAILLSSVVALGVAGAVMAQDTTAQLAGQPQAGPRGGPAGGPGRAVMPPRAPAEGGAYGVITGVSANSFALLTPANQAVTVTLAPDTTYRKGKARASARAIKLGDRVRVLGAVAPGQATTITATHVVLQPVEGAGTETSLAVAGAVAAVLAPVPNGPNFPGGQTAVLEANQSPTLPAQHIGNINTDWGDAADPRTTIAAGAEADKAAEVGMATPWNAGGIVNRVVKEPDGTYLVHQIAHWPLHIFVSADLKPIGADN